MSANKRSLSGIVGTALAARKKPHSPTAISAHRKMGPGPAEGGNARRVLSGIHPAKPWSQ